MKYFSTVILALAATAATAFTPSARSTSSSSITTTTTTTTTSTSLKEGNSPFDALTSMFSQKEDVAAAKVPVKPSFPDVVIEPDYKLGIIFLTGGILLDLVPYIQLTLGPLVTLLGVLFVVQTSRIRFLFDSEAFELRTSGTDEDGNLQKTGENIVVSGENRWTYDSFVNYDFFPKGWIDQPQGPILVYFKEMQTPSDKWNEGPGQNANSEEAIAKGAVPGQVHFFPALCNTKQLRAEFERRGCAKLP